MDLAEFQSLRGVQGEKKCLALAELMDSTPRTLLYGYTFERNTWHLYLDFNANGDNIFVLNIYDYKHEEDVNTSPIFAASYGNKIPIEDLCVGVKRLYPERCDYNFAALLRMKGEVLTFTTFDEEVYKKTKDNRYHGVREIYTPDPLNDEE